MRGVMLLFFSNFALVFEKTTDFEKKKLYMVWSFGADCIDNNAWLDVVVART
jgi:hypothetical protein